MTATEPKLTLNTKAVQKYMKLYWARLDEVTAKYIAECIKTHGYKLPKEGITDHSLKKFSVKLMKKNKKLVVFIVTNKPQRDFRGNEVVKMHIYTEIVKKGLKLGTFKNMIIKRFPKVVSNYSKWEGCDYAQVYGLLGRKKHDVSKESL